MNKLDIKCYIFRRASKEWTAATNDLPLISATCLEPEDALKRMQIYVLQEIAHQLDRDEIPTASGLELSITFEIVSEVEANRILYGERNDFDMDIQ